MSARYEEFTFPQSTGAGLRAMLSLKLAGDMKYDPEIDSPVRIALFETLGISVTRVVGLTLKHTRNVAFIDSKEDLRAQLERNAAGFDGIVTRNPALVPSVTVADCMPIYLSCERCGAFGVLHSGWKGTGILQSAVEGMGVRYGCQPSDISVILGPSIGSCCYAVDGARAKLFAEEFGPAAIRVVHREVDSRGVKHGGASARSVGGGREGEAQKSDARYYLDLLAANRELAASLGLIRVANAHSCTSCDPQLSSYRRDGAEHFQRMLAFVVRPFPN